MKIRTTHLGGVYKALECVALNTSGALAHSNLFAYDLLRDPTPTSDDPAIVAEYEVSVDLPGLRNSYRQMIKLQVPDRSHCSILPDRIENRDDTSFLWQGPHVGYREGGSGFVSLHRNYVAGLQTLHSKYNDELKPGRNQSIARLLACNTM